jgi:hypothetical protein
VRFWHKGNQGEELPRFYGWAAWAGCGPHYWACPVPFNHVYGWFDRLRWKLKCGPRPRTIDLLRQEVLDLRRRDRDECHKLRATVAELSIENARIIRRCSDLVEQLDNLRTRDCGAES